MKVMSTKLWLSAPGLIMHWCPGCKSIHMINVDKPNLNGAKWAFNGDYECPTFTPSINIVGHCHYFITAGNIIFCGDSKHVLAGQTVPLPDMPQHLKPELDDDQDFSDC